MSRNHITFPAVLLAALAMPAMAKMAAAAPENGAEGPYGRVLAAPAQRRERAAPPPAGGRRLVIVLGVHQQ